MKINKGRDAADRAAQKIKGAPGLILVRLLPRGGAAKPPNMPMEDASPMAVPP